MKQYFTKNRFRLSLILLAAYYLALIIGIYFEESYRINVDSAATPSGDPYSSTMSIAHILLTFGPPFYFVETLVEACIAISLIVCCWDVFRQEINMGWRRIFIAIEILCPVFLIYESSLERGWNYWIYFASVYMIPAMLFGGSAGILIVSFLAWIRRGFSAGTSR